MAQFVNYKRQEGAPPVALTLAYGVKSLSISTLHPN